jgi:DNA repair and recombination protein RAD54B
MGMRKMEATGCILADEMGLGKSLQTIALIHTLLRKFNRSEVMHDGVADVTQYVFVEQNPYGGPSIGGV